MENDDLEIGGKKSSKLRTKIAENIKKYFKIVNIYFINLLYKL